MSRHAICLSQKPRANHEIRFPGKHRVRIALHKHDVGRFLFEHTPDTRQDPAGLPGMGPGADTGIVLRFGQSGIVKEGLVHLVQIVLPGLQDELLDLLRFAFPDDGGLLDDLGTSAKDNRDHGV